MRRGAAVFDEAEYAARLAAVRARMAALDLEVLLVSTPENVYYLTGLDHWGYFAPHVLIVPAEGTMVLVTRAMERVTVSSQVRNAAFEGHEDSESAADVTVRWLRDRGVARSRAHTAADVVAEVLAEEAAPRRARIGIEMWSAGLSYGLATRIFDSAPQAEWIDASDLVDGLRVVKSAAEQRCVRDAARVSDAAMAAAVEAVGEDVAEREVAAQCHRAMIGAGGTFPGFGPFIRPGARLGEEHTSWGAGDLARGDSVFLELSGCVRRYHAPTGGLVHVGAAPASAHDAAGVCLDAFDAAVERLRDGVRARDVYAAWQGVVDAAGMPEYRRHHCGYLVGIGFPPSWTGGNRVTGLRADSDLEVRAGMTFHVLSWLMGSRRGDWFVSATVLAGESGAEILTAVPRAPIER